MAKTTKGAAAGAADAAAAMGGGSIDQIRDILFGAAQREQDARAQRIEKNLDQAAKQAAAHLERTERALERKLDKMNADAKARLDGLTARLGEAEKTAKEENAALDQELSAQIRDTEQNIRDELREVSESILDKMEELRNDLTEAIDLLRHEKAGNEDLGDYLLELGMRLKGDSTLSAIQTSIGDGAAKSDENA